jgi:hypothetical protein
LLLASKIAYAFFFLTVAIFLGFNMPQGRQWDAFEYKSSFHF